MQLDIEHDNKLVGRGLGVAAVSLGFAGAILALRGGALSSLTVAAVLPSITFGVPLLTVPALYVGGSVLGLSPAAHKVMNALARGWTAAGAAVMGLLPLELLLSATSSHHDSAYLGCASTILLGTSFGLCRFAAELPRGKNWAVGVCLFGVWTAVTLIIAARLFFATLGGL